MKLEKATSASMDLTETRYLPAKVFKWEPSAIWQPWPKNEDERVKVHLGSMPSVINYSMRMITERFNENLEAYNAPITQGVLSLALIHEGKQRIKLVEGIEELIVLGLQIHNGSPSHLIESWVKPKIKGLCSGNNQYHVELGKKDQQNLSKFAQDLELPLGAILRVCLESVLMDARPEILRQDYREIFKNDCMAFKKWIGERVDLGQMIWRHTQEYGTDGVKEDIQFDFYRDVLGKGTG
jgi:hypothetical protein